MAVLAASGYKGGVFPRKTSVGVGISSRLKTTTSTRRTPNCQPLRRIYRRLRKRVATGLAEHSRKGRY